MYATEDAVCRLQNEALRAICLLPSFLAATKHRLAENSLVTESNKILGGRCRKGSTGFAKYFPGQTKSTYNRIKSNFNGVQAENISKSLALVYPDIYRIHFTYLFTDLCAVQSWCTTYTILMSWHVSARNF